MAEKPSQPPRFSSQRPAHTVRRDSVSVPAVPPASAPVPLPPEMIQVHKLAAEGIPDPRLAMLRAPDSAAASGFRVLRHRLAARPGLRAILVTSPARREGKTTLAVNLALALGEAGRARVLLLEANLRQPSLARLLGFRPPICFGEQLEFHRSHPEQPWVLVETISPSVHVAAVNPEAQTRPLIDGPAIAIAMEQLRRTPYDHIILDSPPILGSADTSLLEDHVDGVLIALAARRSRARALRRATDQLGAGKLIGSVLMEG